MCPLRDFSPCIPLLPPRPVRPRTPEGCVRIHARPLHSQQDYDPVRLPVINLAKHRTLPGWRSLVSLGRSLRRRLLARPPHQPASRIQPPSNPAAGEPNSCPRGNQVPHIPRLLSKPCCTRRCADLPVLPAVCAHSAVPAHSPKTEESKNPRVVRKEA